MVSSDAVPSMRKGPSSGRPHALPSVEEFLHLFGIGRLVRRFAYRSHKTVYPEAGFSDALPVESRYPR
jgi:hypothetical protein